MARQRTVVVTGPRRLFPRDAPKVREALAVLAKNPSVGMILFGGAIGADTEALRGALEGREGRDRPFLVCVVPCRAEDQPVGARPWIARADRVVELGLPITAEDGFEAFKARNRHMVDQADLAIVFDNGDQRSGTSSCARYAEKRGLQIVRIPVT
jgi:predicted Rossmann fold nucleotide-binding protein DprA/Smf involved in DNA uptake